MCQLSSTARTGAAIGLVMIMCWLCGLVCGFALAFRPAIPPAPTRPAPTSAQPPVILEPRAPRWTPDERPPARKGGAPDRGGDERLVVPSPLDPVSCHFTLSRKEQSGRD